MNSCYITRSKISIYYQTPFVYKHFASKKYVLSQPSSEIVSLVSNQWSSYAKTAFYQEFLHSLPVRILNSLSQFDIHLKVSNCLIRSTDSSEMGGQVDFLSKKSMLMTRLNLLSGQNPPQSRKTRAVGSRIHKMVRLKRQKLSLLLNITLKTLRNSFQNVESATKLSAIFYPN